MLISALLITMMLTILTLTSMSMTTVENDISGNYRTTTQAFYVAEAGAQEARARMRQAAGTSRIDDTAPDSTDWAAFIGASDQAQALVGYDATNPNHTLATSLETSMNYTVAIRHKTDGLGNVLYWGDPDGDGINAENTVSGANVYVITSYGTQAMAQRGIEIEAYPWPLLTVHGAVYTEDVSSMQGSSTNFIGEDPDNPGFEPCGDPAVAALATTQPEGSVTINGGPTVSGDPPIDYETPDIDVPALINTYKEMPGVLHYTVESENMSGSSSPGPGDGWGTPTLGATNQDPSTCDVFNIVHFDTQNTFVKFTGGASGCGLLLVEGDLIVTGGFHWYGAILVTGSIVYSGGGNKQVTGFVMSELSADIDMSSAGGASIVYCSDVLQSLPPARLVTKAWKDLSS